ncbi:MAG: nuclear transport factor 2 family protein [Aeromicrobium sp.]
MEDRVAITELIARYSHLVSDRLYDEFGQLYTNDGGLADAGGARATGPEAMAEYVRQAQKDWGPFKQITVNQIISVDGDDATGTSDYVIFRLEDGVLAPRAAGRYDDVYRRTPDGWRFVTRDITPLGG